MSETVNSPEDRPGAGDRDGSQAKQRVYAPDFLTELFRNPLDPGYADAAARRAKEGPRAGWRGASARGLALTTLVLVGFLFAIAYRQTMAAEPARGKARAALVDQIHARQDSAEDLEQRAAALRAEVNALREANLEGDTAERLRDLEALTGLAEVEGDGVVVTVADGDADVNVVTGGSKNVSKVLDRDLQDIANALWASGAEAIAINGERLTATSTIRAAGEAILVDFQPVTSPYEVAAIGPDELKERFEQTGSASLFRALVDKYGMKFEVTGRDDLTLTAAAGGDLEHAYRSPEPTPPATGSPGISGTSTPTPTTPTSPEGD
ncbi:uncharacterized protein YlxW (UPF0749 family) [Catenuloplanes nepalensis]|uniref:Uncharacterized protein YlxW (UPF0749 family) n=1 Tax=Catenuloplanes nepalensis TaxID=587533 RepID=A0ABT9MVV6_9ACTN|nr:DUF881 domain-containing protein [Catenuloplanes nepalensis]MDP9795510.1 uncharacterized protein YlxW (UPF0749 family) [Catenuloplanes nepalensis]